MKKMLSLLLVLIMVVSLLPMSTMATALNTQPLVGSSDNKNPINGATVNNGSSEDILTNSVSVIQQPDDSEEIPYHNSITEHEKLFWNYNTKYHWKECDCGARLGEELHTDPKDTTDDYCICGYHFSDNADLVTLWVKGCPGIKYFDKNKTEYKLNAYTYKDVKEIKISTRTHDSEATVELPEDLTLKQGENKFEVKVTSENQKVTKIYTLIITKE